MKSFHNHIISCSLIFILLFGLNHKAWSQEPTINPGTDGNFNPTGIIIDGINKGGQPGCAYQQNGHAYLQLYVELDISTIYADILYFQVHVEDNAGNIRSIILGGNTVQSFSFSADLSNGTVTGATNSVYDPISGYLEVYVNYRAALPLAFPSSTELITVVNVSGFNSSTQQVFLPFTHFERRDVCLPGETGGGNGGKLPGMPSAGGRLANPNLQSTLLVMAGPNPFSGQVSLVMNMEKPRDLQVRLVDIQGRVVQSTRIPKEAAAGSLETSSLAKGMYILIIEDGRGNVQQQKMMKVD